MSGQQIPLQFQPRRQDSFETFVAGANRIVVDVLEALPLREGHCVFIQGEPGSGKTHLLNAVCHRAQQQGMTAIYLPLSRLDKQAASRLNGLENTGLVCVDDLDVICGQASWEEAIFHLVNRIRERGGNLLIAARQSPAGLPVSLADLRSRLSWGQVHRVVALAETQRRQVLKNYALRQGFEVPEAVLNYFFSRSKRNLKELMAAMDLLGQSAFADKRAITVPLARKVLMRHWQQREETADAE